MNMVIDRFNEEVKNGASKGFNELTFSSRSDHDAFIRMENELKMANLKTQHLQRLSKSMETMIEDKDLIISLLQSKSKDKKTKKQFNKEYDDIKSNSLNEIKSAYTTRNRTSEDLVTTGGTSEADLDADRTTQHGIFGTDDNSSRAKRKSNIIWGENDDECSSVEGVGDLFAFVFKRLRLYVGRVQPTVTAAHMKSYLKVKYKGQNFVISQLATHENSLSRSFRVGADVSLEGGLMDPKVWPKGVAVKPFHFFRYKSKKQKNN